MTDDALIAFVMWCRLNPVRIVSDPVIARHVFDAYAQLATPAPGEPTGEHARTEPAQGG